MTEFDVVVVGAVNVDMVVNAPRLPAPGETVVGRGVERHGGGKGANAAVAAARAGGAVCYVGAVGDDDTGRQALRDLQDDGVDTSGVDVSASAPTGVALIVVGPGGENQIAVGAGANDDVTAEAVLAQLGRLLPGAGCLLVSTEIPAAAVAAAVHAARTAGVRCVLNPAPVLPVVVDLLGLGPLLTPNAGECLALAEQAGVASRTAAPGDPPPDEVPSPSSVGDAARALAELTGSELVVTLGADGVLVVDPAGAVTHVPPRPATVRDTTGAGDTFNGVLALALARGAPLDGAVRLANVAASLSVGGDGARGGMPTADELTAEAAVHACDVLEVPGGIVSNLPLDSSGCS